MLKEILGTILEIILGSVSKAANSEMASGKYSFLDEFDWYCDNCDDYLNSQSGFYTGCGDWQCTKCGSYSSIDEDKVIYNDDYFNDNSPPGPGCIACGNSAYPNCKSSCPIFDD